MSSGKAWVFGENVDTDQLAPGAFMKSSLEELSRHCLESLRPEFASQVGPGDFVVAGKNFGMGSSREQAAQALVHLKVAAVIAPSFAGIFQRNAFNLGLLVLECPQAHQLHEGDTLAVDARKGEIFNQKTGERLRCAAVPEFLMEMLENGGLVPHLERKLRERKR